MRLLHTIESRLNRLFVFELHDGYLIESVHYRGDTLCVSTQVGCPVQCDFCASGREGLFRNLSEEEIYSQYIAIRKLYPVKRIAIAGIGEPLANWKNVKSAFWKFKREGLKVSFYTTGFPIKNLDELLELPHNGVTLSIHTTDKLLRKKLMPYAGDINLLIEYLRKKIPELTRKRRKKISLAYLLMKGVNDSEEDLTKLAELAISLDVSVTLLYYNEVSKFKPVQPEEYERAFIFLRSKGVKVTLSTRFRRDKIGGCGTLTVGKTTGKYRSEVKV